MKFRLLIRYFVLMLALAVSVSSEAATASNIKISTDASKIGVGETFHITIEATNCPGSLSIDKVPPGCKVVYKSTSSSSSTMVRNGQTEKEYKTALILTVKGETPGSYSFGPVSIDGVKSNVAKYQVVNEPVQRSQGGGSEAGSSSSSAYGQDPSSGPMFIGKGNEEMFLKASVNKTSVYEQEAIVYTVKLYTSYHTIKFLGATAAPKFDGFVVEESQDVSKSFVFEDYNGKTYQTAVIARYIIFPQKPGDLRVIGNTYTVSTDREQYYHDPYFSTMTVRTPIQLNITPNDINIHVKALPTPIPSDFIGGVGNFSISSSMPSKSLATNAAGSLVFTVRGTGNIKYVKLPDLAPSFPQSFEIYSPEVTVDARVEGATVGGTAKFDYSIVPKESGTFTIPALTFSYFDPESGEYKKMSTESYTVDVSVGKSSDKSQQALRFDKQLMPADKGNRTVGRPYVESVLYWLWYAVPVIIFLLSLAGYRKYLKDREDMTLLRSKKANKMALKRLSKAYRSLNAGKEEEFYDNMLSALWGYIGDKLKMPTSELTRSNVSEEFEKHNVSEQSFMPIINLIDECEYAKYTPVSRDANMRQLYADALECLSMVESEYSERKTAKKDDDDEEDDETI